MIHETAVIAEGAAIADGCSVGAYTVIDANVELGGNCRIGPHCYLTGFTRIGEGCEIHKGAVLGDTPQDYSFSGEESYLRIGAGCVIREYATIHVGAEPGTSTQIGSGCMLMGFTHVGHNCLLGDKVALANTAMLSGHVEIGDNSFISGGSLVHQFVRIGRGVMATAGSRIGMDIPPFCLMGEGHRIYGPNSVGLKRAGLSPEDRRELREVIKLYFFENLPKAAALDRIREQFPESDYAAEFCDFVEASTRGITRASARNRN